MVDTDEIAGFEKGPGDAKGIDPETRGLNRILYSHISMPCIFLQVSAAREEEEATLTLRVICPATPSSNPSFAKIRNANASRPFRYVRSSYLSVKVGGRGNGGMAFA